MVRAGSPAALLTLVPHLLGFVPEASLVVIGVARPRDRIRVTLRYDLPEPPEPGMVAGIVAQAVAVLADAAGTRGGTTVCSGSKSSLPERTVVPRQRTWLRP